MAAHDPSVAVKTLKSLAKFRRSYPEARPLPPPHYADTVYDLIEAVVDYRRWISRAAAPDEAMDDVVAIEELANVMAPATSGTLDFSQLWLLVRPKSDALLPRGGRVLSRYKGRIGLWSDRQVNLMAPSSLQWPRGTTNVARGSLPIRWERSPTHS